MGEPADDDKLMNEGGKWRANWLPSPHFYNLNQACALINKAFRGGFGCYLVGSSLFRRDWRDVDVRLILEDDEYMRLFKNDYGWTNPLWSLLCTSLSLWLGQQTGLPVDFQIQQQTAANRDHPKGKRSALGIFIDYPGERPTDVEPAARCEGCGVTIAPGLALCDKPNCKPAPETPPAPRCGTCGDTKRILKPAPPNPFFDKVNEPCPDCSAPPKIGDR